MLIHTSTLHLVKRVGRCESSITMLLLFRGVGRYESSIAMLLLFRRISKNDVTLFFRCQVGKLSNIDQCCHLLFISMHSPQQLNVMLIIEDWLAYSLVSCPIS